MPIGWRASLRRSITCAPITLGLNGDAVIELNLHLRNSALTEFKVNPKRHTLVSFNTLPHLDPLPAPEHDAWVTHA
jgi:hypothetical protein